MAADVFAHYAYTKFYGVKNLVLSWLEQIHPRPAARAIGALPVECALRRKGKTYYCHLVNINVPGRNNVFETQNEGSIAVEDVEVTLDLPGTPRRVLGVPAGETKEWRIDSDAMTIRVGRVEIMESLAIDIEPG